MNTSQGTYVLSHIPLLGPRRIMAILDFFGSIENVWLATRKDLARSKKIPSRAIPYFFDSAFKEKMLIQYTSEKKNGTEVIAFTDHQYPPRLRNIPDPPMVLFGKGQYTTDAGAKIISIVGTRKPTRYGLERVEECIDSLSIFDPVIVSGMAYGIDAHAHRTALSCNLKTLGVMANGLGRIYPAEHRGLAKKIMTQGGLLTEYSYHVQAEREFFPMRNRIVAGLADVTIVVESGRKGGSMITAWMANEYQREVCTYPGSVSSTNSQGPHQLIKSHQAHLIESGSDVAEIMNWVKKTKSRRQLSLFSNLSEDEKMVIETIENSQPIHIDPLTLSLGWSSGKISLTLIQLEMKGLISGLPGNQWQVRD